jgi:endonuclease/exonuclease/phosphatase (EEP) superfamily protein YafD
MGRARQVAAWTLVAGTAAWVVVRWLGLESGFPLVPLLAYTPLAAVGAVVAAIVIAAMRQWVAAVLAAILALMLVVAVVPRAFGGPTGAAGPPGPRLAIMSVNLRRAGADPDAVVALVRRMRVDVLTLQEVDGEIVRRLEAAGLRQLLTNRVVRLGPGTTGTALYARATLTPAPGPVGTRNPLAEAQVAVAGARPVVVTTIHTLAPSTGPRAEGWARDFTKLPPAQPDGPVRILAGDFNATLDHDPLRDLIGTGYDDAADALGSGLRATWPVGHRLVPPVTIDHVLADDRCGIREYKLFPIPRSDHRAVFAVLELPAG